MVLVGGGMALAGWFNGRVPGLRALCMDKSDIPYSQYLLLAVGAAAKSTIDPALPSAILSAASSVDTPRAKAFAAQSALMAHVLSDTVTAESLQPLLDAVRQARSAQKSMPDPEDGPATPYFVAARWLHANGEAARAAALARDALDEAGERPWAYRKQAEALALPPNPALPREENAS